MQKNNLIVAYWLFFTCFMVGAMAVIGAITRLTESGLSIVEWHVFKDMMPPLHQAEWERLFAVYQTTPEYLKINHGMSLEGFKQIYFWEWFHRLWGRLIGVVYALPLVFFWLKNMIPQGYKGKLLFGLLLGGLQGFMGWYMVASGLVDRPDVSHYRLAAHLGLAFVIFGYLYWLALSIRNKPSSQIYSFCLMRHGIIALVFLTVTIIWGAFTAGLEAGMIYNTWPLMGGQFTPPEALTSITESHAWVQFSHRWLAAITLFVAGIFDGGYYAPIYLGCRDTVITVVDTACSDAPAWGVDCVGNTYYNFKFNVERKNMSKIIEIDVHQLKEIIDANQDDYILIDVREVEEYKAAHIKGSVLLPLSVFTSEAVPHNPDKKIIFHCRRGGRSEKACIIGFDSHPEANFYNVVGGMDGWLEADYPAQT
jgi:cytochrome c oxidase assembly protein subunit 15